MNEEDTLPTARHPLTGDRVRCSLRKLHAVSECSLRKLRAVSECSLRKLRE